MIYINDVSVAVQLVANSFAAIGYGASNVRTGGWPSSSLVAEGMTVFPTATGPASGVFVANNTGRTDASEPTWPGVVGNTVVDNEVTWQCLSTDSSSFDVGWPVAIMSFPYILLDYRNLRAYTEGPNSFVDIEILCHLFMSVISDKDFIVGRAESVWRAEQVISHFMNPVNWVLYADDDYVARIEPRQPDALTVGEFSILGYFGKEYYGIRNTLNMSVQLS